MDQYFLDNNKTTVVGTPAAAAQTVVTTAPVEATGFTTLMFTALFGALAATSGIQVKLMASNTITGTALSGTVVEVADSGLLTPGVAGSGKAVCVGTKSPAYKYYALSIARTVANSAVTSVTALQYGCTKSPPPVDPTVISYVKPV